MFSGSRASFECVGGEVQRSHILALVRTIRPPLVALVAPSGYGKTLAASQIARDFTDVQWVDLGGREATPRLIAGLLKESASGSSLSDGEAPLVHRRFAQSENSDPDKYLPGKHRSDKTVCIVFDDVGSFADVQHLLDLADRLRCETHGSSLVVVTARDIERWTTPRHVESILLIDQSQLAFDESEARQLADLLGGRGLDEEFIKQVYVQSQGHPALLRLMLRHPASLSAQSRDLLDARPSSVLRYCIRSYLDRVLTAQERSVIHCAALLGSGTQSDLALCLAQSGTDRFLKSLAEKFPLVRISSDRPTSFSIHDLVLDALTTEASDGHSWIDDETVDRIFSRLRSHKRYHRLLSLTYLIRGEVALANSLVLFGHEYLASGEVSELKRFLDLLSPGLRAGSAELLLLQGEISELLGCYEEALEALSLAERVAESVGNECARRDAAIRQARTLASIGRLSEASAVLSRCDVPMSSAADSEWLLYSTGWALISRANSLDAPTLREEAGRIMNALDGQPRPYDLKYRLINILMFVYAEILGDSQTASRLLRMLTWIDSSEGQGAALGLGNLAIVALYTGRVSTAKKASEQALAMARRSGALNYAISWQHNLGLALVTTGEESVSGRMLAECRELLGRSGTPSDLGQCLTLDSMLYRSSGQLEDSLERADEACALFESVDWRHFKFQAATERLASRLALGDEALVYEDGLELRKTLEGTGYSFYLLRLDMVLAEIERRRGELDKAASRIAEHAEHIRGEGSNWHMAMYTRAFPGLLSVFARALGPDGIPIHMLRMLLEPTATRALAMAQGTLDEHAFRRLVLRTLGKARGAEFLSAHEGPPVLRVRLFGGLSVEGPQGPVPDKAWGKRKARLLFAMLAVNLGQDVPRDVIFDRLWPDMPADRAQSNFYVTWSYMKKALAACAGDPTPYLEHRGGVCRVVPEFVTTDLAEFFHSAEALRKAKAGGESESVIDAAERMAGLYAGELLAGDLYEDWCSETRERVRHEFSDAMLAGAEALADRGEPSRAVRLVRAALAHDPWREDLYQAALRYQIMAGQRSSAIETYMACRDRLAEDLGLDPSVETQRLYEQVLAMEEGVEAVPA